MGNPHCVKFCCIKDWKTWKDLITKWFGASTNNIENKTLLNYQSERSFMKYKTKQKNYVHTFFSNFTLTCQLFFLCIVENKTALKCNSYLFIVLILCILFRFLFHLWMFCCNWTLELTNYSWIFFFSWKKYLFCLNNQKS
jgi:hypothetical protein